MRPPRKIVDVQPVYPEEAQAAGVQGVVILQLTLGRDGTVLAAEVVRSIPLLDPAALEAVRQWRFEPVLLNGEPREAQLTVTVNFTLKP
jgi:protein TonB